MTDITRADIIHLQSQIDSLRRLIEENNEIIRTTMASKEYVRTYIELLLSEILPAQKVFTETSHIHGYEPLDIERVLKHFERAAQYYAIHDFRVILRLYDHYGEKANINPYLAVAQMAKETDFGRSWWSRRPRRNPAGIGVTGETTQEEPKDKATWVLREDGKWVKGYSFPSWEISVQAHYGHLLAYMYVQSALTSEQVVLVAHDPRASAIKTRGTVKTLQDLDGKWATGLGYGRSIAILANALRS